MVKRAHSRVYRRPCLHKFARKDSDGPKVGQPHDEHYKEQQHRQDQAQPRRYASDDGRLGQHATSSKQSTESEGPVEHRRSHQYGNHREQHELI